MTDLFHLHDASLKRYNTLGIQSTAADLYLPFSEEAFKEAILTTKDKKRVILGNGSNILLAKAYYDDSYAFVVSTNADHLHIVDGEMVAEAGCSLQRLAWFCIEQGIVGYEFAEDIPGTIGGALISNAGQFEYTIGMYVTWIDVYLPHSDTFERIKPDSEFFGYRRSKLEEMDAIVLACGLRIPEGDGAGSLDKVLEYKRERYRKQPRNHPNAGSVFKRPTKGGETFYVWKLFEEAKLRGFRIGDAEVSAKHPGFIVNHGNATHQDMLALVNECQKRIKEQFDIDLHLEWKIIE
ncbi:MAG: UDP-N-acetylmuramate dehydrogenase [Erysipelotrichaceae bacterium]